MNSDTNTAVAVGAGAARTRRCRPAGVDRSGAQMPSTDLESILFQCSPNACPSKRKQTEVFMPDVDRGGSPHVSRARAVLVALALLALLATAALVVATPGAVSAALAHGASTGDLLAGLALLGAWAVTAWVVLTALAVAVAALPGAVGRLGRAVAAGCTPALLRGIVRTALGASVVAGPLLSGTAFAAAAGPRALPGLPLLDR